MANNTIAGRLKNPPDVQKAYMWELFIPSIEELSQDDMVLRIRNVVIPGRSNPIIESHFMGTKQFLPGKTEYTGSFTTNIEEFEDQFVHTALHSWMQYIFDYDPSSPTAGDQKGATKLDYARDMVLKMYKSDGTEMPNSIKFFGAWPQTVADATLDYTASDSVKFDVTWQYDYWLTE